MQHRVLNVFALCLLCVGVASVGTPAAAGLVSSRIYQPVSLVETNVEFRGEPPQPITAHTADGLTLEGAYWPPEEGVDQVVVVFHGNSYNHMVSAYRAEPLKVGGRGVLIASYRGYGDNPGKPSEAGLYADAEAWLAKADELAPDSRRYLFGFSLGSAVAIEMAARHDVSGVATMGAFTRLKDMFPGIARALVTERYDNLARIGAVEEPLLLMHGTKDDVVDSKAVAQLEDAGGPNVVHINLTGGGHWVPLDGLAPRIWAQWEALEADQPDAAAP
ncbi:alpha/beta hydrolase [Citromicrobium bathyomarinum]|uniref:alpha/beta hydrolase n=1 Tax=Citromicrobium bathyomarinum TaxID=72174 RepID=UPI00315A882C